MNMRNSPPQELPWKESGDSTGWKNLPPLIRILDADPIVQMSVASLLDSVQRETAAYSHPEDFLSQDDPERPGCLILEARLTGRSGPDLQNELLRLKRTMPVVFITAFGDIRMAVKAMLCGAIDFLEKPYRDLELLDAVERGIARDRALRSLEERSRAIRERISLLSGREREVADLVASGMRNRQIAERLGLQEPTVKLHRMWAMRKLGVTSLIDLVDYITIAKQSE